MYARGKGSNTCMLQHFLVKSLRNRRQIIFYARYQSLSLTSHINCIVARWPGNVAYLTACAFIRSWYRSTFWMTSSMTLDQHKNKKNRHNPVIASLKIDTMGKLTNIIPGSRLLISSLPGSALRTLVESLGKPRDINKRSQILAW